MADTLNAIPPACSVDYTNADAICGYQLLLCKIFEHAGGFELPAVSNASIREVQRQGALWLKEVRSLIADILCGKVATLAAIPDLLDSYDLLHRVCTGSPCFDYLREVRLRIADRWLRGDKTISDTDVTLLLLSEANRDIRTLEKRYVDYTFSVLGKWIDELTKYGRFISTPLTEAYKRLAYLLRQDLFVYINSKDQPKVKAQWIKAYALTEDQLDRLATRDLWSYISFANTASSLVEPAFEGHIAQRMHLLYKLASRSNLYPFYREAIEIDLAQYQPV